MYKISIITVCLNSEKTIEETIKSVIQQKNESVEYIIVDGKSSDRTLEIINEYSRKIDKVVSEKDNGISDAFNKGIALAEGEYIGIINSDDMLLPWALKSFMDEVEEKTDVFYGQGIRSFSNEKCKRFSVNESHMALHTSMPLCHPATFVKKSAYEKWGCFDLGFKYVMDRELLLRMLNAGARFQYSKGYYAVYRMGGMSDSQYLKGVLPEMYKINVNDGMSSFKARAHHVYSIIYYYALHFRNEVIGDPKIVSYEELIKEVCPIGL